MNLNVAFRLLFAISSVEGKEGKSNDEHTDKYT